MAKFNTEGGIQVIEFFMPFIYLLGVGVFMTLTFATWKLMTGIYKPAQYIMSIFVERRKTAEIERQTEQIRLERVRLESSVK